MCAFAYASLCFKVRFNVSICLCVSHWFSHSFHSRGSILQLPLFLIPILFDILQPFALFYALFFIHVYYWSCKNVLWDRKHTWTAYEYILSVCILYIWDHFKRINRMNENIMRMNRNRRQINVVSVIGSLHVIIHNNK